VTWSVRRGIAFAAVVALHAGLVITLTFALRTPTSSSPEFIGALIFLTVPPPPPASSNRPRPQLAVEASPVVSLEPPTAARPLIGFPPGEDTVIDWAAEARRAAAGVAGPHTFREFGRTQGALSRPAPRSAPAHQAGEQYRDDTGQWIVWISDRCYLISDTPTLAMPWVLARSIPARTVCQSDAQPRSDLFKDLPAFSKYHPQ
jgi:hypothetical protein